MGLRAQCNIIGSRVEPIIHGFMGYALSARVARMNNYQYYNKSKMIPLVASRLPSAFHEKGKVAMGEEEAGKDQDPVKNNHKEATDVILSLEEKRKIFGQRLRTTREELNQTKKDVIHLTRISPPFIDALEEGKFDALPGEVFGRGFVKNICKVLEIDSAPLLEEFNQCWERKQTKTRRSAYSRRVYSRRSEHKAKKTLPFTNYFSFKGIVLWVLGPSAVVAILLLGYFGAKSFSSKPATPTSATSSLKKKVVSEQVEKASKSIAPQTQAEEPKVEDDSQTSPKPQELLSADDKRDPTKLNVNTSLNAQGKMEAESLNKQKKAQIIEVAPKGFSLTSKDLKSSYLMVLVKEETTIKYRFDQGNYESKNYSQGLYKFKFNEKIDIYCNDMSKLDISFKGRKLGDFGINRDSKQLSFIGKPSKVKKL